MSTAAEWMHEHVWPEIEAMMLNDAHFGFVLQAVDRRIQWANCETPSLISPISSSIMTGIMETLPTQENQEVFLAGLFSPR
jgi:hypothetical protein